MTLDTNSTTALVDLVVAVELFRVERLNPEQAVDLVHALERYDPAHGDACYLPFLICRDQLIRDLIDLHPHAFPSQEAASCNLTHPSKDVARDGHDV
ncbi:hypothetical protein [Aureimonas ureilytica]|uniref:hypothetical protein n=1 Tax=Aureimonas ureilytica TaxID=401562 RepID=UPI0012DEF4EE|nr:hypothetical protein [Aureimonas ureilytica]